MPQLKHRRARGKAPVTKPRPVVAPAFGKVLLEARVRQQWSQQDVSDLLKDRVRISGTFISHVEHGKVASPDPVLLRELALIYGLDFGSLVELLRRNRQRPHAVLEELLQPEEGTMIVRGDDEYWIKRYRAMTQAQRADVKRYMDFLKDKGAATAEATFPDDPPRKRG